ncbi:MAG: YqaA family protein [Alphaproteobacteria bacterium]
MLRSLYDWTMRLAARKHALWALAAISFAESSVFPIPPDVLIIPIILSARERALAVAVVATLASVAGGLAGYGIGHFLFEELGRPILAFYGATATFESFRAGYNAWGGWIVAMAGFTPFPYKVVTIASGVFGLDLSTFMVASAVSRGARFFLEAALLWYLGPPVRRFVESNLQWLATLFFVLLFAGFLIVRYLT